MRNPSLVGLVLVLIGLTFAMARASSTEPDWSGGLACGANSNLIFTYDGCFTACGDLADVCDAAIEGLLADMADSTYLFCASCNGGPRCTPKAVLLSGPITTDVAYDPVLECWVCTACYDGTHEAVCTPCPEQ